MVMGTYANLYAMEQINDPIIIAKSPNIELKNLENDVKNILPELNKGKFFHRCDNFFHIIDLFCSR